MPAVVEEIHALVDGLIIESVTLDENSPGVDKSIAELQVRSHTRMTVAAIMRGDDSLVGPNRPKRCAPVTVSSSSAAKRNCPHSAATSSRAITEATFVAVAGGLPLRSPSGR